MCVLRLFVKQNGRLVRLPEDLGRQPKGAHWIWGVCVTPIIRNRLGAELPLDVERKPTGDSYCGKS